MWLRFLPVNQAWVFLFGEDVRTAQIVSIGGIRLFGRRSDAVATARAHGLTVDTSGQVS